jgi:hypothetical protein
VWARTASKNSPFTLELSRSLYLGTGQNGQGFIRWLFVQPTQLMRFYDELRNHFAPVLKDIGRHIRRGDLHYGKKDFSEKGNRLDWRLNRLRRPSIPVARFKTTEDAQNAAKELEIK